MVVHAFDPSAPKAEEGGSLEFEASQGQKQKSHFQGGGGAGNTNKTGIFSYKS